MPKRKENEQNSVLINLGLITLIATIVFLEIKLNTPTITVASASEYEPLTQSINMEIPLNNYYSKDAKPVEIAEIHEALDMQPTNVEIPLLNYPDSAIIIKGQEVVHTDLFTVTAYDLSYQSTGKRKGDPWYGITAHKIDLRGKSWNQARVVAVDPEVIPLGTKLYVEFTKPAYGIYNGIYTAGDVGGAIKGNKLDFFIGDFDNEKTSQETWNFGRTKASVTILR